MKNIFWSVIVCPSVSWRKYFNLIPRMVKRTLKKNARVGFYEGVKRCTALINIPNTMALSFLALSFLLSNFHIKKATKGEGGICQCVLSFPIHFKNYFFIVKNYNISIYYLWLQWQPSWFSIDSNNNHYNVGHHDWDKFYFWWWKYFVLPYG